MTTKPLVTEPGFTWEDAANSTGTELGMFNAWEVSQLLDDAVKAGVEYRRDAENMKNDAAAFDNENGKAWLLDQERQYTAAAKIADNAVRKLLTVLTRKVN